MSETTPEVTSTGELPVSRAQFRWWRLFTTFVGGTGTVAAIGLAFKVFFTLDAHGEERIRPVIQAQDLLRAELEEHKREEAEKHERLERKVDEGIRRQDLKSDAILMGLHLPNPAPTPRDGGTP